MRNDKPDAPHWYIGLLGNIPYEATAQALYQILEQVGTFKEAPVLVEMAAVEALEAIGQPAVPQLVRLLESRTQNLAGILASSALERIGAPARGAVEQVLRSGPPRARQKAAEILGKIADRDSTPALVEALKDPDLLTHLKAVRALGAMGEGAVPALAGELRYADDEKHRIYAQTAVRSLSRIGPPAVPFLLEALPNSSAGVRCEIVDVLGQIKDRECVPALIDLLKNPDEDGRVRYESAFALGSFPGEDAKDALFDALDSKSELVLIGVATGLAKLGISEGKEYLVERLQEVSKNRMRSYRKWVGSRGTEEREAQGER
jgi:HEAT repeat protein